MSGRLLLAVFLLGTVPLAGQERVLSPRLAPLLQRDTVVTVWVFGQDAFELSLVAAAVETAGGAVRRQSRWLHAVSAEIPTRALQALASRPEVRYIQPLPLGRGRPERPIAPTSAGPAAAPGTADSLYGPSSMPFRRLNLLPLANQGLRGQGVRIAILDTGFETTHSGFASANVVAERDFVFDDFVVRNEPGDVPSASQHGTMVWSLLAANVPGSLIGVAPEAAYLLAKTEDIRSETRVEEDNWVAAVEWADSIGVDIIVSSLGYLTFDGGFGYQPADLNGDIAVTTVVADSAAARGIAVIVSVGNGGPAFRSLTTPADGDSVLAIGAEDSLGTLASFSSRGPTADHRLKPDLVAPGQAIYVVDPLSSTGFARVSGTSFSTPLVGGAAALVRQLHPTLPGVVLHEALRRTGDRRDQPDSLRGWGRPDAAAAAYFPLGVALTAPSESVLTSVTPTFTYDAPLTPTVAHPVTYRVRIATDSTFVTLLVDTVTTATSVTLGPAPLRPRTGVVVELSARSVDSVRFTGPPSRRFEAPEWVTLAVLNDPAGHTVRDRRPTFRWTSPSVTVPPGPFRYDLAVVRSVDGVVAHEVSDLAETEYTATEDLERNTPYRWRVTARLGADTATVESRGTFVVVDDSEPTVTLLFQNFPNPFPNRALGRSVTCIWFDLAAAGQVRLDILDVRGHIVRTLIPAAEFPGVLPRGRYGRGPAGTNQPCDPRLEWDGTANDGTRLPRGVYLVRLSTPAGTFFRRAVFMGFDF